MKKFSFFDSLYNTLVATNRLVKKSGFVRKSGFIRKNILKKQVDW